MSGGPEVVADVVSAVPTSPAPPAHAHRRGGTAPDARHLPTAARRPPSPPRSPWPGPFRGAGSRCRGPWTWRSSGGARPPVRDRPGRRPPARHGGGPEAGSGRRRRQRAHHLDHLIEPGLAEGNSGQHPAGHHHEAGPPAAGPHIGGEEHAEAHGLEPVDPPRLTATRSPLELSGMGARAGRGWRGRRHPRRRPPASRRARAPGRRRSPAQAIALAGPAPPATRQAG